MSTMRLAWLALPLCAAVSEKKAHQMNHVRVQQIANILHGCADGRRYSAEELRREANWLTQHVTGGWNRVRVELTDADLASSAVFYKGFLQSGVIEKLRSVAGDVDAIPLGAIGLDPAVDPSVALTKNSP